MTQTFKSSEPRWNRRLVHGAIGFSVSLAAILFCATPVRAQQRTLYSSAPPSMEERQRATQVVVRYLATWNERDPERRRAMLSEIFVEDGSYMDPNRHGVGYEEIDTLMRSAQRAFPGYTLRLVSTIDTHHNGYVRFSWAAGGMPDAPIYLAGTNFARLTADGRIQSMVGFGDAAAVSPPLGE